MLFGKRVSKRHKVEKSSVPRYAYERHQYTILRRLGTDLSPKRVVRTGRTIESLCVSVSVCQSVCVHIKFQNFKISVFCITVRIIIVKSVNCYYIRVCVCVCVCVYVSVSLYVRLHKISKFPFFVLLSALLL